MNVAFIPARGGSKSIPLKNIKLIFGKPLVFWAVTAACECDYIDAVYVATDSKEIRETILTFADEEANIALRKLQVISRSEGSATDTASTESAMLEFAEQHEFDNIVLIQATSPLLTSSDLTRGFEIYNGENIDSVLSVVKQKRFTWSIQENGYTCPTNYDIFNRPRRQDFIGYYVENGAFYICNRSDLLRTKNRISGRIAPVEMPEDTFFEIDEPSDWFITEALMKKNNINRAVRKILGIRMFLTDCDGCLTDGGMYYSESGDELKKFNTRDGMGFDILRQKGIICGIITSESVEINRRRAEKLKLDILEVGCIDKLSVIRNLCDKYRLDLSQVCYVGDDINDIEAIKAVGLGCCPGDAISQVKTVSQIVTNAKGGNGVIREIIDRLVED